MKTIKTLCALAVAGLVAFGCAKANAAPAMNIVQPLNFKLVAWAQTNWYAGNGIYQYQMVPVKIDTKTILALLEAATGNTNGAFADASLVLVNIGEAIEVRRGDVTLTNVSSFFYTAASPDANRGTYNDNNGKDTYLGYYAMMLDFDDGNGHILYLSGLVKETYKYSAADPNNGYIRQLSDSVKMRASGSGEWEGRSIVVSGTISAKGKGYDYW